MRPSAVLDLRRSAIREVASRFRTANPRIFGSLLHGSDLDWLMHCLVRRCLIWVACKTTGWPIIWSICSR